jgi:uncharacterized protein
MGATIEEPQAANSEPDSPASDAEAAPDPAQFSILVVEQVRFDLPSPSPVLHLIESAVPYRVLRIPVGLPEAQALAQAIFHISAPRPMTHELFAGILGRASVDIVAVRITGWDQGVFQAEIDLVSAAGRIVCDCRPTDGVILALRQRVPAPILCDVAILEDHAGS